MNCLSQPWLLRRIIRSRQARAPIAGGGRLSSPVGRALILTFLCLSRGMVAVPQSSHTPQLQQRPRSDAESSAKQPALLPGHTDLPKGAWGEYAFGDPGEVIELNLEESGE